jgi:hypothetical protein
MDQQPAASAAAPATGNPQMPTSPPVEIRSLPPVPLAAVSRTVLAQNHYAEWHPTDSSKPANGELPAKGTPASVESGPVLPGPDAGPETQPKRKPIPPAATIQAWLKQRIETACGSVAQGVDVIFLSGSTMLVRLQVRKKEDGIVVSKQVFEISELLPYDINLEVKVAR